MRRTGYIEVRGWSLAVAVGKVVKVWFYGKRTDCALQSDFWSALSPLRRPYRRSK